MKEDVNESLLGCATHCTSAGSCGDHLNAYLAYTMD